MGVSDNVNNAAQDLTGKVKETAGDVTGDDKLKAEGLGDQISANVKDGLENAREFAENAGENIKEFAGDAAENVKNFAEDATENVKNFAGDAAENIKEGFGKLFGKKDSPSE